MRKTLLFVFLSLFVVVAANADTRLNFKLNYNRTNISAFGYEDTFVWESVEGELEIGWPTVRVLPMNAIAIGIRKTGDLIYEGTYLSLRALRRIEVGDWEINPSVGLIFGGPGVFFSRTWESTNGDYVHVFPVRNANAPANLVKHDGIVYPELSIGFRRKIWRIGIEPVAGVRLMKFGAVRGGEFNRFKEWTPFSPYVGIRVGILLVR